jgi:hypothetical protein
MAWYCYIGIITVALYVDFVTNYLFALLHCIDFYILLMFMWFLIIFVRSNFCSHVTVNIFKFVYPTN